MCNIKYIQPVFGGVVDSNFKLSTIKTQYLIVFSDRSEISIVRLFRIWRLSCYF